MSDIPLSRRERAISVLTALAAGAAVTLVSSPVADAAVSLPTVTVHSTTAPMTNLTPHTGVTRTASCPTGTLVGGGGYLRNATDPTTLPTNGLVLGGTNPSTGAAPIDQPAADGATNPGDWMAIANFTGVAEAGDQATAYALCAAGGPTQTVVESNSTVGANATQQVAPPNLTVATCPTGTTLLGGGAFTSTPDQVNDGTTTGNNGNLKPLGDYPSDASGVPAADGSTSADSWSAYGSAGITSANDKVTAFALCTSDPVPPVQVARVDVSGPDAQPGTTITTATAVCPTDTRLLGGGYRTDQTVNGTAGLQPQQGYHMRGSYPSSGSGTPPTDAADGTTDPNEWSALLQAGGQSLPTGSSMQLHGFAMCAQSAPQEPTPTATSLSVTPSSPAAAGTQETLKATVDPAAPGTVRFRDGNTALGDPITVTGGTASLTTTLPPGTHSLTAAFVPADPTAFAGSTSAPVSYVVKPAAIATTTKLYVLPNPSTAGKPVALIADVSPRQAAGTIRFFDGDRTLGSPQRPIYGIGALVTTKLTAGKHTLTARFTPTDPAAYGPSTSRPVTLTVKPRHR